MCNELTCLKSVNRQYPAPIADLQQDKLKVSSTQNKVQQYGCHNLAKVCEKKNARLKNDENNFSK